MNVYATNRPDEGYEFNGSFTSLEEAKEFVERTGGQYTHWWCDNGVEWQPEWTTWVATFVF